MHTNPITNQTSLKNRPVLRAILVAIWISVTGYLIFVLGVVLFGPLLRIFRAEAIQTVLGIPAFFLAGFDLGVDILLTLGFWFIGSVIFIRRSDDWFAILTSLFLITFGARITNFAHITAQTQGYEVLGGLVLMMGDMGIVLLMMLFPDGKFVPGWLKYLLPVLAASMAGIYLFPKFPFYWMEIGVRDYSIFLIVWYLLAMFSAVYRYRRQAALLQRQQIRWVLTGALGPFLWFLIFEFLLLAAPSLQADTLLGTSFSILSRLLGIFMFLMLPVFIAIAIARYRIFDIDLLIHRSLVYGVLTIGLVIIFTAVLAVVSLVFKNVQQGDQSLIALTVSAVSVGALFQPARKKLQRFVDRFFFKIQIDYQKTPAEIRAEAQTMALDSGPNLPSYRTQELIGRGGMAEVYRAEDPVTGQTVAIKVLLATLAADEQFRRRFLREAEAIVRLNHPNVVKVREFGQENGIYFIVMDYLTGPALNQLLKQKVRLQHAEVLSLLGDVAKALDYAHQQGLVHRDVKPSNVVLDTSTIPSRAVLTDFGIAKIVDAHTRITATNILGTFDYIAPEQIQASSELDGRADIYALGIMAYQLLAGELPFKRPDPGALLLAHMTSPPPDIREAAPDIPRQAAYAIQKAMAKKPEERFATANEFVTALAGV